MTAMIESGRDVPFQTVEDGEVNIEYKKAVLSLKVTPHVIDSQTLRLAVKVNKDEVDFSQSVLGNPTIITKQAETNVIQVDGQTLVIGGLNKETTTDDRTGCSSGTARAAPRRTC
jgi:type IV pilus assembly protein PilQ